MRKRASAFTAGSLIIAACAIFFAGGFSLFAQESSTGQSEGENSAQFRTLHVLSDDEAKNRFAPTGWMGDTQDIKTNASYIYDRADLGKTCLKITYLAQGKKEWAGIYWQNPPNNWGREKGGYNLKGARYLTFWAKGEKGGEKISEFKMGGMTGKYPDSDMAWLGPVKLKKDWNFYKIDLKGKDLSYIAGGFCFTVLAIDNVQGCAFYLADVKYE